MDDFWHSFLMSAIHSFLKRRRQIQIRSGNDENAVNTQPGFGSPLRDSFFDPVLGFYAYFGNHWTR